MRKKVSSPGRMHDYLLVAGVYAVVFVIAWLFAKAHLEPSQSPSAHSGAGERVRSACLPRMVIATLADSSF